MELTLEELKAKNQQEEEAAKAKLLTAEEGGDAGNEEQGADTTEQDAGGSEDTEVEPWQAVEGEEKDARDVPVGTHIKVKQKLKGRISERDEEIEKLKIENAVLKAKQSDNIVPTSLKRPKADDFDSTELYKKALDEYEEKLTALRYEKIEKKQRLDAQRVQRQQNIETAVDGHYDRAEKLVNESGIDPEIYKQTDKAVREAINSVRPKEGDIITDQVITILGDGSEKVLYFLGRNENALLKAKGLLAEDPSGMKLSIFLGQQKERLTNPKKPISQASAPAPNANGDANISTQGKAALKKYKEAHKNGNIQVAYNAKKEARQAGVDVSQW